jgi:pimeloyl-ACP methyl ester carboxylesterase
MRIRWLGLVSVTFMLGCAGDDGGSTDEAAESSETGDSETTTDGDSTDEHATEGEGETDTDTGEPLEGYDDPALWLCHPDKSEADDQCRGNDLSITNVAPDGSTTIVEHVLAEDPAYDCFYVYPTVDLRLTPGQTENFDDISYELDPLLNQAARFTAQCRMFAPLYHQVTFGTFGSDQAEELLDAAYQDVAAAFESYLAHHHDDRPLVILGHSQGTRMTTRLIQEFFETDPVLRERLIAALLIGGSVSVPEGEVVGGTFSEVPLCETAEQTGCVIAYRTYAEELPPGPGDQTSDGPGLSVACTDPAALLGVPEYSAATFATFSNQAVAFPPVDPGFAVRTPFIGYGDLYAGSCQTDVDGNQYLAITVEPEPGDVRENPIDFAQPLFSPNILGLHVLDYQFPLGELLELVAIKAEAMGG